MTQNKKLTRVFDNESEISVTISGHTNIENMIDLFRGFLVQIGYAPEVAARLQLVENEDSLP